MNLNPPLFPEPISKTIVAALTDPARPGYGQVATVDEQGNPQVRTVHLRYLSGSLAFATHTRSPKWVQLKRHPVLAGCLYDPYRMIQLRWEGGVRLVTEQLGTEEQRLRMQLWSLVRPDVRSAYWLKYRGFPVEKLAGSKLDLRRIRWGRKALQLVGNQLLKKPCPTFSAVLSLPSRWDILEIDLKDYRRDQRTIYELKAGRWMPRRVSIIDSTVS